MRVRNACHAPLPWTRWVFELPMIAFSLLYYRFRQARVTRPVKSGERVWTCTTRKMLRANVDESVLDYLLCRGPRLNTHLFLHHVHGVTPGSSVVVENLRTHGFTWQIVVYGGAQKREAIATIAASDAHGDWIHVPVPCEESVTLSIRPYVWGIERTRLPRVVINGSQLEDVFVDADAQAQHQRLRRCRSLRRWVMMYHVHPLLRLRHLHERYVRSMFMPVPNPHTDFRYGPAFRGEVLRFIVPERLLDDNLFYMTVYDTCSLPVHSVRLSTATNIECDRSGSWLLRVVRKDARPTASVANAVICIAQSKG